MYRSVLAFSVIALGVLLVACGAQEESAEPAGNHATTDSLPSLQAQLDARKQAFVARAEPEKVALYEQGVVTVAESDVMETALQVGDTAPDFTLPGATGDSVSLSALLAEGPVVLTWYRGGWCPYCNIQLQALNAALPDIRAAGAQLVAISPEVPDSSLSTAGKGSLEFHVASDVGNRVARDYGIAYVLPIDIQPALGERLIGYNGDSTQVLPLAVTYVVDTDRRIRWAFVDADYRKRAEPSEIVAFLRSMAAQ